MEKTWAYREQELREEIAKSIELGAYLISQHETPGNQLKEAIRQAADKARYNPSKEAE